jgi:hypothetical protein
MVAEGMSVYGLPLVCKQAVSGRHGTTAYVYPASKVGMRLLMPGHNGLFARQLPIALSYFKYVDIPGISRRRSHLFAISQFA